MNVYKTHVRPQLEYGSQLWNMGYMGDMRLLERVQRRWTREIRGFGGLDYSDRLQRLGLFSFQGRLLRADMIMVWKIFHNLSAIKPCDLFCLCPNVVTRGHPYKIARPRCRLDVRCRYFSVRVIPTWNSLQAATVSAQTLDQFKRYLHKDLETLLVSYS